MDNLFEYLLILLNAQAQAIENFQSMFARLPGHVYLKDIHGTYLWCNEEQARDLNFDGYEKLIGKTDYDLSEKSLADQFALIDQTVIQEKKEIEVEEKILKNGLEAVTLTKKIPVFGKNNQVIGVLGTSFDITDRKKIEEELRIAKEKAEVASQAKDDFISDMEHDLRTPFSGIGGIANLLYSMSEEKYPEFSELLKIMMTSCEKWEEVHQRIFNVLVVEQINPLNIETVSISKEVKEIQDMQAAILYSKNIQFILEPIPIDLDLIETDALKFHLVLSNLISNAIKFTEKGSITVNVSQENNYLIIKVIDTGIGIPDDKFEYIFEKFTKLSRSNTHGGDFQGVGIGLYVARAYANQLGATIDVESEVGKGSTFSIKLLKKGVNN